MILATITGNSATNRIESMVRNANMWYIYCKKHRDKKSKGGILNVDGAR